MKIKLHNVNINTADDGDTYKKPGDFTGNVCIKGWERDYGNSKSAAPSFGGDSYLFFSELILHHEYE